LQTFLSPPCSRFKEFAGHSFAPQALLVNEKIRSSLQAGSVTAKVMPKPDLILIGASTGGTQALVHLLKDMPYEICPPVMVVQHIPEFFSKAFRQRLMDASGLKAGEMHDGQALRAGHLYMALGSYHIAVIRSGKKLLLKLSQDPPILGHRPSVEYLFQSAARINDLSITAILLTGMGRDGAQGLKSLNMNGAFTIAQDPNSSTVFGMPKEAIMLGAVDLIGSPLEIRSILIQALQGNSSPAGMRSA
jgi:two-component system chemotaxis response regulator CheB